MKSLQLLHLGHNQVNIFCGEKLKSNYLSQNVVYSAPSLKQLTGFWQEFYINCSGTAHCTLLLYA